MVWLARLSPEGGILFDQMISNAFAYRNGEGRVSTLCAQRPCNILWRPAYAQGFNVPLWVKEFPENGAFPLTDSEIEKCENAADKGRFSYLSDDECHWQQRLLVARRRSSPWSLHQPAFSSPRWGTCPVIWWQLSVFSLIALLNSSLGLIKYGQYY